MSRATVASSDGKELVLKYKDGEKKFIVPANIEVVMLRSGDGRRSQAG